MKKITIFIISLFLLFPLIHLKAQQGPLNAVKIENKQIQKVGDSLIVNMRLNLDDVNLSTQEMIVLTPKIKSTDNIQTRILPPVVITGGARGKALKRSMVLDNYAFEREPREIIRRHNNRNQEVMIEEALYYQQWMRSAELTFEEELIGCACDTAAREVRDLGMILPPPVTPVFHLTFIFPEPEIKVRSETHKAHLNFIVDKYDLLRNYKDNARVLDEVDRIITDIRNDKNVDVQDFRIVGYASPEGNIQSNWILSENRAYSFVNYLQQQYGISPNNIQVEWRGEDWEGLKEVVEASDIPNKFDILNILDIEDRTHCKKMLQQYNGGRDYRFLLNNYYPPLRRNEYTISYIAKPFDVQQAREIIKTQPHYLSQNEIYLVANSYPRDSEEFREVFAISARTYPDDPVAIVNALISEIENENYDLAIEKLMVIDMPQALNNMGICHAYKKDFAKAKECFDKAAMANLPEARLNAALLAQWMEDQY